MTEYLWLIIVVGVIILALVFHYWVYKTYHYICPKCSTSFKPTFFHSLIAINAADYRKMRCPTCNHTDYMKVLKDKNRKHN